MRRGDFLCTRIVERCFVAGLLWDGEGEKEAKVEELGSLFGTAPMSSFIAEAGAMYAVHGVSEAVSHADRHSYT